MAYPNRDSLEELQAIPPNHWTICRRDVARAVRMAGNSAPGPDGIPYKAWQALGGTGLDTFWAAIQDIQLEGVE